jgi:Coenzyme PQQ synthesis protein D (PqqD)
MLGSGTTVVRVSDLVTAPLGKEIAMLNIDSGSYFVLDEIAAAIWARLESPITPARICDDLRQRYDVAPAQCEADVLTFLGMLHAKGLLRIVG